MNLATKKIVAKEVLIITAYIAISLTIFGIWYTFLGPDTRVHPITGEVLIIKFGTDEKVMWEIIAALLIIAYPVRFTYCLIRWAIKTLREPSVA